MSSSIGADAQRKTSSASRANASLSLQQQSASNYLPPDWDSLSPTEQAAWDKAVHEYYAKPFWAEPLPLPPEIDFKAIVEEDMKLVTILLAIHKIADRRGVSVAAQLDTWNYGRGAQ